MVTNLVRIETGYTPKPTREAELEAQIKKTIEKAMGHFDPIYRHVIEIYRAVEELKSQGGHSNGNS